jgi:hypothetical protein
LIKFRKNLDPKSESTEGGRKHSHFDSGGKEQRLRLSKPKLASKNHAGLTAPQGGCGSATNDVPEISGILDGHNLDLNEDDLGS